MQAIPLAVPASPRFAPRNRACDGTKGDLSVYVSMRGVSAGDIKEAALCRLLAGQARADAGNAESAEKRRAFLIAASDFDGIADTLDAPPKGD